MLVPRKLDYADCYQGLIRLIVEEENMPSFYMNTKSWGINYKENVLFDINKFQFLDLLSKYYGLEITRGIFQTSEEYIKEVKSNLKKKGRYTLIKADVSSCKWHKLSSYQTIYHFLLITDCSDDGKLKCIDIFYPEDYHEYDIVSNINNFKKLVIIDKNDAAIDLNEIWVDFIGNVSAQLKSSPSYSEKIILFSKSEFLSKIFSCNDQGEYDKYLLAAKRLSTVRADIYDILKNLMPNEKELLDEWDKCVKQWRKYCNYMIKNTIVPARREILIEKARMLLLEIGENEETLMRRIISVQRKGRT